MASVSSLFSRWRLFLRTVAMAVGLSVTVFVGVPAAAAAQLPKTYQSPAKSFQTQTAPRACMVGSLKTQCFTITTYRESVHSVLPSTNPLLTRLAGSAGACGTYSVTQSASWTDWGVIPFPPYVVPVTRVTLRASAGYNYCGGSWTNWITPTCTVYVPSFDCAG